ncbi:unnamed protein product [Timema podura]|uniref:C2H2-type domain-containing protein n=1 Tax=Timema podura TaxID=61482 RepID=A0ABN7NIL3_TIMPD|nr:unnamed protein product [Timema podura]
MQGQIKKKKVREDFRFSVTELITENHSTIYSELHGPLLISSSARILKIICSPTNKQDVNPSEEDPLLIPKIEAMNQENPKGGSSEGGGGGSEGTTESVNSLSASAPPSARPPVKRRVRRRATSASQDPAEQLTEMSVRGLNLFRYASISEGVYQCTECAKADVQKTFKNKYSFQRHAFLYHEGHQRKVFPCPVCAKEFSRPDKMKNHMKTVHDCFMPKDCVFPLGITSIIILINFQPVARAIQLLMPKLFDSSYTGYIKEEHPSITFQLLTPTSEYHHTSSTLTIINDGDHQDPKMGLVVQSLTESTPGVHFLSHEVEEDGRECILVTKYEDDDDLDDSLMEAGLDPLLEAGIKDKSDLLEYLIREDGSVVCKWCGEVLPSRTHWYRHKYKFHVPSSVSPSPTTVLKTATLLKCHRCNVFFKSRKGFTGHLASRHSEEDKSQSEDNGREPEQPQPRPARRSTRGTEAQNRGADYEKQREKEEKLVADIIDRVRRECEAQGATVTRRGYTRRSTVMNS